MKAMNEEKYYLIILNEERRSDKQRKILIKGLLSFMRNPGSFNNIIIDATAIVSEKGYPLIWAPFHNLRAYDFISIEDILEFEDLDAAKLVFEIE